jgi:hypothetical protein
MLPISDDSMRATYRDRKVISRGRFGVKWAMNATLRHDLDPPQEGGIRHSGSDLLSVWHPCRSCMIMGIQPLAGTLTWSSHLNSPLGAG